MLLKKLLSEMHYIKSQSVMSPFSIDDKPCALPALLTNISICFHSFDKLLIAATTSSFLLTSKHKLVTFTLAESSCCKEVNTD